MLVVVVEHERADAQRRGVRGCHRDRGQRRELLAEVVGHEQRREAEVFELAGLVAPRRRRLHLAHLHAEPERSSHRNSLLSCEAGDDGRERIDRVVIDHVVRHLPAFAPLFERRDDARPRCRRGTAARAARRRARSPNASAMPSRIPAGSSVTCTRIRRASAARASSKRSPAASRTQPIFWSVAAGVSDCAASGELPSPDRRFALMPTICASRAASPRIFGAPPPTQNGNGCCTGFGMPSRSVTW